VIADGETLFDYREYRAAWDKYTAKLDVSRAPRGLPRRGLLRG